MNTTLDVNQVQDLYKRAAEAREHSINADDLVQKCIAGALSEDAFYNVIAERELQSIRSSRPTVPGIRTDSWDSVGSSDEVFAAAFGIRAGKSEAMARQFGARTAEQADKLAKMPTIDIVRRLNDARGLDTRGNHHEIIERGFSSTGHLPSIVGQAANAVMRDTYQFLPWAFEPVVQVKSVADFRAADLVRVNHLGSLSEVGGGERTIKTYQLDQEMATIQAHTYAANLGISRKMLVNDEVGALADGATRLARMAKRHLADSVATLWLANGTVPDEAGTAFFSTAHGNYHDTGTSALGTDGAAFDFALSSLMKQTDKEGNSIDAMPQMLLIPPELFSKARTLLNASAIDATSNTRTGLGVQIAVEPRLSNSSFTGASATGWYLLSRGCVTVAYLNGVSSPKIESFNSDPSFLGIVYRVVFDYGCCLNDYRLAVKNVGA